MQLELPTLDILLWVQVAQLIELIILMILQRHRKRELLLMEKILDRQVVQLMDILVVVLLVENQQ